MRSIFGIWFKITTTKMGATCVCYTMLFSNWFERLWKSGLGNKAKMFEALLNHNGCVGKPTVKHQLEYTCCIKDSMCEHGKNIWGIWGIWDAECTSRSAVAGSSSSPSGPCGRRVPYPMHPIYPIYPPYTLHKPSIYPPYTPYTPHIPHPGGRPPCHKS